ncbi:translocase of chloroplast 101, chloroplastic-like [Rutidosis leptorrhynchoides]|uniref:translocase of chloroplast 101, chloroplastic-like n=1 Tax=Rutidosis leptorrhynchoides TaxID=125765 RepID=UPI003A9975E2
MDSKEDTSLSGKIETVNDTNGLNSVIDSNNKVSNLNLNVNSDDETEGFVSGQEEDFETVLDENLVSENETLANVVLDDDNDDDSGETFSEAKVELDDVDKDTNLSNSIEGDKVCENKVQLDDVDKDKVSVVEEDKVSESKEELANGVKVNMEGDSIVDEIKVDTPVPGVAIVPSTEQVEDKVEGEVEDDDDEDEDVLLVGGVEDDSTVVETREMDESGGENDVKVVKEDSVVERIDAELVKPASSVVDSVGEEDMKVTASEEDLLGEKIDVDLPKSEADVVTKTEAETPELEDSVDEKVEEVTVSEEDSVVEKIDVDLPIPGVAGVAVVTKAEEDGGDVAVTDEGKNLDPVLEEVVDKEVVGVVTDGKFSPLDVEMEEKGVEKNENISESKVEKEDFEAKEKDNLEADQPHATEVLDKSIPSDVVQETEVSGGDVADNGLENGAADKFVLEDSAEKKDNDDDEEEEEEDVDGSVSDEEEETDGVVFGSSAAAKQFMEELEGGSSQDRSQMIDGQIVTDSDEEDEDDEEEGKELFDSAALAALLKAAADSGGPEGGNITFSSQDGSRLFTVERPAGLGPSVPALRAGPTRPNRSNIFNPASLMSGGGETEANLTEDERKKLEKLQSIRVKFLRIVQKLGLSPDESVAAQVLYRLALIAGRQTGQLFSLEAAKRKAMELEADENEDLDFLVNILVIGKVGVGKSATINSIFGEEKTVISAFEPATGSVKEIRGVVAGVTVRVFDTPGLKSSLMDQGFNRSVLTSAKKLTKKNPPDIVLYVDRLDSQTRDHNDIPLLKTITSSLGSSIWRSAIVTLTHGASAPPEGSNGAPLSYEMFVTQRSHLLQQAIGQAVGDLRMMSPSLMNPVSLVENHQSCRKNREGQKVLPNGQTWRPQLLMLCYSMKILAEANALIKPQDPYDNNRKLFGFRVRSPPLPYMLSSMLQSRAHPKLSSEQGGDAGDSDVDLADLTDSDNEQDEDEYDQLPPFKPLKKSQLSKLSKEQKKAYFDEYDYRVKLLQKKQWKEELKRLKEMKKKGKNVSNEQVYQDEEGEGDAPAPVAVPLPDMALPPSFDSDNPAYRFRFLEPTSQFLARPVLDTHGWDHDCGYDGVNLEQTLAIANRFPAAVTVQVTKDKKDFSINLDSSVSAKHGENMSTMAGFDVQPIGKQLAYIVRGETKFKNLKKNKTAAGVSVTFLGENVVTGFKVEDQITLGKQYSIIGSAGTVRFQSDSAYGANVEIQRRELDYPIGQVQSTLGLSIIKWRGDLALGFNSLAQFSAGRNSKVAVRAGINNKMSGQITVKTSSSEHLVLALVAVVPSVISAYKKLWGGAGEKYSGY